MKTLLLVLALLVTGSAQADWMKLGDTPDVDFYIDLSTVRKEGSLRKVWEVQDLKQGDKSGVLSRRIRKEYDCKQERVRILYISAHSGPMLQGDSLITNSDAGTWSDIPPGTASNHFLEVVCSK